MIGFIAKARLFFWNNLFYFNKESLARLWYQAFLFRRNPGFLYKNIALTTRQFHSHSLLRSFEYYAPYYLERFLETNEGVLVTSIKPSIYPTYQYVFPKAMLNVSLHNKEYRVVLFKFLHSMLHFWQLANKGFDYTMQFIIITRPYLFLRCYNVYYFKIYNF